jgi:hypothetical protein
MHNFALPFFNFDAEAEAAGWCSSLAMLSGDSKALPTTPFLQLNEVSLSDA